jgi:uncharacterized protein
MATEIETEIETPHGAARAHVQAVDGARGTLVLGHGAGGGVGARDLVAAAEAARATGFSTALVEQPYRVAGRRSPAPAHHLDAAWTAVIEHLRAAGLAPGTLVVGGRSSGARVACRTAAATRADGVLCLAFPLQPPARAGKQPAASRLSELEPVGIPVLIVQGQTDRFGIPPEGPSRTVVLVRGDHALRSDLGGVSDAVRAWLSHLGDAA